MRILVFALAAVTCFGGAVVVRDACGEDASAVATIQQSDSIRVEHGVVGESTPCYAVSIARGGETIRGYISDATLPAVVEFERRRATESRIPIPEPPPPPPSAAKDAVKPAEPKPAGPPFEPWSGVDIKGKRFQVASGDSKVTLVTFWAAESAAGRKAAENVMKTQGAFLGKGVRAYGFVQAIPRARLSFWLDDMGLNYPLAMDSQGLASRYGANPSRGTTLVIDASNHIVASTSDPKEIRAAVLKLLSSE